MAARKMSMVAMLLLYTIVSVAQTMSPSVQPAQGGYLTGGNLQMQFTVGEPLIQTFTAGGQEFSLGFEQPEMNLTVGTLSAPFCAGSQISIPFNAKGIYGLGNIFTAQLSDSSGSFASPLVIEVDTEATSDTVIAIIPDSGFIKGHYKIRLVSSYPAFIGGPSGFINIGTIPDSLSPGQQDTVVCPGSTSNIYVLLSQPGVRYDLIVNSVVIASGYGNDTTIILNTGVINNNTSYTILATDTLSGCNRQLTPGITIYTFNVGIPVKAVPQMVLSDTAVTFTFSNITAGSGGNQVVWALDSNFTTQHVDTSPTTIVVTVHSNSDTLIWLKSRDSISGCTSYTILTFAQVDTVPTNTVIHDTLQATCTGTTTVIAVDSSLTNVFYKLYTAGMATDSSLGNDSLLFLNTAVIDSNSVYNIIGIDTTTHSIVYADSNIYILAINAVDTPVFITGDTLIYRYDTTWTSYTAIANNSTQTIYRIVDGSGAIIDSITGKLDSIWGSSFTVRAIVYGMPGCDTTYTDLHVTETTVAALVTPAPIHITVDSPHIVIITFDTVYAGTGADEIEWAFNPAFTSSTVVASPAVISFALSTGKDTAIYIRSKDSKSGNVSRAGKSEASVSLTYLSAALLDKTGWKLIFDDEFIYPNNTYYTTPSPQSNFLKTWAPNFCWDTSGNCADNCYNNWVGFAYNDYTGKELEFKNGVGTFAGTRFSIPDTTTCTHGGHTTTDTSYYRSANISTRTFMLDPSVPSISEIRCQTSAAVAAHPTFWPFGGGHEFDIMENNQGATVTTSTIHDNSSDAPMLWPNDTDANDHVGCQSVFYKQTPCSYSNYWHTYSMLIMPDEIIFFVDGKESWSDDRTARSFPSGMISTNVSRILLGLGIDTWAAADSLTFAVDYVRFYNYPGGSPPMPMQNLQAGIAKTIEPLSSSWGSNNIPLYFPGNSFKTSSNIINSKMASVGTTANHNLDVFYIGANNNVYKAAQNTGNNWTETTIFSTKTTWGWKVISSSPLRWGLIPISTSVDDFKDFLTPADSSLVYYQSTGNQLKYLKCTSGHWTAHIAVGANCGGYINIGPENYVWYKGTDNNMYLWKPATSAIVRLINNGSAVGAMVAAANSLTAFYVDGSHYLWEYTEVGGSGEIFRLGNTGNVSNYLALDETNSRIYFIGLDSNIYYYTYNLLYAQQNNLTQLGNAGILDPNNNASYSIYNNGLQIDSSANAASGLTLSYDKNNSGNRSNQIEVYYKGNDGNLWYYFNDNENTTDPDPNLSAQPISAPNWNKSCITCGKFAVGNYIAVEPSSTGKLFYTSTGNDGGNVLYFSDWVNADNSIPCPIAGGYTVHQLKIDTAVTPADSVISFSNIPLSPDTGKIVTVSVYPNPSDNDFIFSLNNLSTNTAVDLRVEDVTGRPVYQANGISGSNTKYQLTWITETLPSGIYIYRIRINNRNYSGKLAKT